MEIRIGIFDTEYRTNNKYISMAICSAFERHPAVECARVVEFHDSFDSIIAGEFNVLLAVGSAANVHWQMPRWRAAGVLTIFWATEDPYELTNNILYQDKFDLLYTNDLASLAAYDCCALHLPLAGSIDLHSLEVRDDSQLNYDLLFVGTAWPNRVSDLNYLIDNLSRKYRLKIALPGNPYIPKPELHDPHLIYDWLATPSAFAQLANRSRLTLSLGRNFSGSSGKVHGSTPPPRIFELGLAGTAQVFISRSSEVESYYDSSSELIVKDTIKEALPDIESLLLEPSRRHDLALAIQARTKQNHTYDHRVQRIVDDIVGLEKRERAPRSIVLLRGQRTKGAVYYSLPIISKVRGQEEA